MKTQRFPQARTAAGFSLVEVVLALGIISFTLVSLIGLLAGGLQSGRESAEDVQAAHIAGHLLAQRRAAPLSNDPDFLLPPVDDALRSPILGAGATEPFRGVAYLTPSGLPSASAADRHYRMDYRQSRNAANTLATVHISLTTPWQAVPPETGGTADGARVRTRFETITFIPVPAP